MAVETVALTSLFPVEVQGLTLPWQRRTHSSIKTTTTTTTKTSSTKTFPPLELVSTFVHDWIESLFIVARILNNSGCSMAWQRFFRDSLTFPFNYIRDSNWRWGGNQIRSATRTFRMAYSNWSYGVSFYSLVKLEFRYQGDFWFSTHRPRYGHP